MAGFELGCLLYATRPVPAGLWANKADGVWGAMRMSERRVESRLRLECCTKLLYSNQVGFDADLRRRGLRRGPRKKNAKVREGLAKRYGQRWVRSGGLASCSGAIPRRLENAHQAVSS